ncbi:transglutaminase domain-containing protein [Aquimarina agarilytica]|uniref:transglutaminase domain-containing protein n=1 Tax=Aquimarina agarilytica TaxID=1087449 RepID=UPI000287CEB2|nr:transglutaminase domain-containing protein [Aquimarina agarilytica]
MSFITRILSIGILFCTINFSSLYAQSIAKALEMAAGNKMELQKVLDHYKNAGDPQKYEAAVFLIKHMPIHYSQACRWYNTYEEDTNFEDIDYPDFDTALEAFGKLTDSIKVHPRQVITKDIYVMKADFLIQNIDLAFKMWRTNPWASNYDFTTFCEYILPYRSLIEPLQTWRADYSDAFFEKARLAKNKKDPMEVLGLLMDEMKIDFKFIFNRKEPIMALGPKQLTLRNQGTCTDYANLAIYASRSVGLPVTFDYTPHHAASSNRHFWNSIIDSTGNHLAFDGYHYATNIAPTRKRIGKVIRTTYSIQEGALANQIPENEIPPGFMRTKNYIDVTAEYVPVSTVNYTFSTKTVANHAYLNVFNKFKWKPTQWSRLDKNGNASFTNMGRNIVYLPSIFKDNVFILERFPILNNADGTTTLLAPNFKDTFDCTLTRDNEIVNNNEDYNPFFIEDEKHYQLRYWDGEWKPLGDFVSSVNNRVNFKNVPKNALFMMVAQEEIDGFERVFTIDPKTHSITWY